MIRGILDAALGSALASVGLIALALVIGRALPAAVLALDPQMHGLRRVYVMDAGRGLTHPLSPARADSYAPVWSRDGLKLAYVSNAAGQQQIVVSGVFGGGQRVIYTSRAIDQMGAAAWSPDGRQLAFTALQDTRIVIYIADLATGGLRQITSNITNAFFPSFSADGRELAFSWSPVANAEVWVVALAGLDVPVSSTRSLRRLTYDPGLDSWPVWSPDGRRVAFVSDRDDNSEIYVIDADGTHVRRLTDNLARDIAPAWTPDGLSVTFASTQGGSWAVWQMPADCPADSACPAVMIPHTTSALRAAWRPG